MNAPRSAAALAPAPPDPARPDAPRLRAEGIGFTYPDGTVALSEVDLAVRRGEIVAVLGPSGAGKSTLMRCLAGMARPTSGTVRHDGVDHQELRGTARRRAAARVGLVFQEFQLVDRATVLSNVLTGRLVHQPLLPSLLHVVRRADREVAVEVLVRVGLGEQLRKRADALSGGQRQRVAIARAMAQRPDVLLADEPVTSLDPRRAREVVDDIVRLVRAEGLTTVLNLHDVAVARRVADRLVGMRDGRLLWDRPVADVTEDDLTRLYRGSDERVPA